MLLDEHISTVHFSSDHAAGQLIERLSWAIRDAERAELDRLARPLLRGSAIPARRVRPSRRRPAGCQRRRGRLAPRPSYGEACLPVRRAAPPPPERAETGRRGEELAAAHLVRRGFRILDRNVRGRYGEIDLVASDGAVLAFVEVKTTRGAGARCRRSSGSGARSGRGCARLALSWLLSRPRAAPRPPEVRFDAIGVVLDAQGRLLALEHLEGAW